MYTLKCNYKISIYFVFSIGIFKIILITITYDKLNCVFYVFENNIFLEKKNCTGRSIH